jgi:[ribosomal protein S18]-alanine N-acetyltransferase
VSVTLPRSFELIPMEASHLPAILPIEQVAFGKFHWSTEAFVNEMANPQAYYCTLLERQQDGSSTVLGYGGCWVVCNEGHITTLAVDSAHKGGSLGELMLTHLYGVAVQKEAHWLTLEVRGSNMTAQNLYYKYGFRLAGRRPRYYQDNQEDALLLTTPELANPQQRQVFQAQWQVLQERLHHKNSLLLVHSLLPTPLSFERDVITSL